MKVILVSGKAQNGKDTVAQIMATSLKNDGKHVLVTHYADSVSYTHLTLPTICSV